MSLNIGLIEVTVELAFYKKHGKSSESEKVDQLIEQSKRLARGKICLQKSIDAWRIACDNLSSDFKFQKSKWESWEIDLQDEIFSLKSINEKIRRGAFKENSQISSLQSELKNDEKRALEAKLKNLDYQLTKTKAEECPICFEVVYVNRKWTAFVPCGHRICSECADKFSAPHWPSTQHTNRQKCLHCRHKINCFLVLEGIYES